MGFGSGRIDLAKDALAIFVRSLPVGCKFSIISFGSHFQNMNYEGQDFGIPYDEGSKNHALAEIAKFDSSFGGTDILSPLREA